MFFTTFMDEIIKICKIKPGKSRRGYWKMRPIYCQAIAYADYIFLIAGSKTKLQEAVIEWYEIFKKAKG